jgi:Predicted P-loop-containing kinase
MLRGNQPFFLDYQGGRKGALHYDIASLLYDGKADLPPELRQQLLNHYLVAVGEFIKIDRDAFMRHYYAYVYVRIMQALGAYGFRGFFERKPHFLQSVPYALKNLRWLIHNVELPIATPTLIHAFRSMLSSEKLQNLGSETENTTVRIFSFSFHQGFPKDESGNGGGFVFDARSLPNPGREERFKKLTGKDIPVKDYLVQQESVHLYLANAASLGGRQPEQLSEARFQEPDGVVRLHGRTASFGLSGGTDGGTSERQKWR